MVHSLLGRRNEGLSHFHAAKSLSSGMPDAIVEKIYFEISRNID